MGFVCLPPRSRGGSIEANWVSVFTVALENTPAEARVRKLTGRERAAVGLLAVGHAQKLVAYELGLSESVVSSAINSALHKLGAGSRTELVALYTALAATSKRD